MTHNTIELQAATANINGASIDTSWLKSANNMGLQVIASGFNTSDATVKVQHSNDGTNWSDITDASITIASGSSAPILSPIASLGMGFYRAVFTKNTNSAGTLKAILSFN